MDTVPWADAQRTLPGPTGVRGQAPPVAGPLWTPGTARRPDDWTRLLRTVLSGGEQPTLVAQPIAELGAGLVVGYEMLARFTGPPDAPPDVWFAEADRRGYGQLLTVRAVERALLARRHLPYGTYLSVNVHPHLLVHPAVHDALLGWGSLDRVVIELTGAPQGPEPRLLSAVLDELRRAGAQVALAESGAGSRALRRVAQLEPDFIRVDRALVAGLDLDPARRTVLQALAEAGRRIDARVVAQGVETASELRTLAELGVPLGQGWLLGRPAARWPRVDAAVAGHLRRAHH